MHMAASDEKPLDSRPELDPTGTVDLSQIEENLRLTPAERLRRLDEWVRFTLAAHRAFKERHGIDPEDLREAQRTRR